MGWTIQTVDTAQGSLVCTKPGHRGDQYCADCKKWRLLAWKNGASNPYCTPVKRYGTTVGGSYRGHPGCSKCKDNLRPCPWNIRSGAWRYGGNISMFSN